MPVCMYHVCMYAYEGVSALRSGAMSAACACVYVSCVYVCMYVCMDVCSFAKMMHLMPIL